MWLSHCARCAARMRAGAIQHKVRCKARKARRIGGRRYSAPHRGRVRHRWKWRAGMLKGKRYRRLRREVRRALRRNGGGVDCVGRVRGGVKGIMRGMAVWVAVWALLLITTPDERYDADEMRRIVGAICVGWVLGNTGRGAMRAGGRIAGMGWLVLLLVPGVMAEGDGGGAFSLHDVGQMALGMAVPLIGGIFRDNRPSFATNEEDDLPHSDGDSRANHPSFSGDGRDGEGDDGWEAQEGEDGRSWVGADMSVRRGDAGLRICTFNAQRKLDTMVGETPYIEMVVDEFMRTRCDIMVIQEPGKVGGVLPTANFLMAQDGGKAFGFESESREAGCLVLVSRPWATLDPRAGKHDKKGRVCSLEFTAAEKRPMEPLQRLLVVGVHGYNSPHIAKAAATGIVSQVSKEVDKFRSHHPAGSVIVVGDLNAAVSRHLDTDRQEGPDREKDAGFIDSLRALSGANALHDVFRAEHPAVRAVTRQGQGERKHDVRRRLDYVLATSEVAFHMSTQIGIHKGSLLGPAGISYGSDHTPVVMDCAVNCADVAGAHIPVWEPCEVEQYRARAEVTADDRKLYSAQFTEKARAAAPHGDPEAEAAALLQAFLHSAEGTIVDKKVVTKPSFQRRRKKGVRKEWRKVRTWARRMRRALYLLHVGQCETQDLCLLEWRFKIARPESFTDGLMGMGDLFGEGRLDELYARLYETQAHVAEYEKIMGRKARYATAVDFSKLKDSLFNDKSGKGKGPFISKVMKRQFRSEELAASRRGDGTLATSKDDVDGVVHGHFSSHFASKVSLLERWGSHEAMASLCTDAMPARYAGLVRESYVKVSDTIGAAARQRGWWGEADSPITGSSVHKAADSMGKGKAAGKSKVTADMVAQLDARGFEILAGIFDGWRVAGAIPDTLNTALIRLLPKTSQGLADLAKCRPVALMEHLTKIYEHIMIGRVTAIVTKHGMLHPSQYGAVERTGVHAPLRVLAEAIEDSMCSKRPLHVYTTDLSKAFDTEPFWSQELGWRCLGMPEHLIQIMVNLDSGCKELTELASSEDRGKVPIERGGEVSGATTEIILGHGNVSSPFEMHRGVRQGSVGGPLKWIVFMNFLLVWIHSKLEGRGYKFTGATGQPTIEEFLDRAQGGRPDVRGTAELIGQMFIDDSIWATSDPAAMQQMVVMIEEFCSFHGLKLNRDKCDYFALNAEAADLRWKADVEDGIGKGATLASTGTNKGGGPVGQKPDGRVLKYLGVWFETTKRWSLQREALAAKVRDFTAKLMAAKVSLQQAVYLANTVVLPAVVYPLNVASVPHSLCSSWDASIRAAVRRAGSLPKTLPVDLFYLPVKDGGIGLRSIADEVDRMRVINHVHALHDVDLGRRGSEWAQGRSSTGQTLLNAVVLAAERRREAAKERGRAETHTVGAMAMASADRLGVELVAVNVAQQIASVGVADREHAMGRGSWEGGVHAYTDGGLDPGVSPRAGFGVVLLPPRVARSLSRKGNIKRATVHGRYTRLWGRLAGEQNNSYAEAMALLQAMRHVHIGDDMDVYIDNLGVIQRWDKLQGHDVRGRIGGGARAVWSRIQCLQQARNEAGARTEVHWVHSHVEDKERQERQPKGGEGGESGRVLRCACAWWDVDSSDRFAQGVQKCDPSNYHHVGNDAADEAANQGKGLQEGHMEREEGGGGLSLRGTNGVPTCPRCVGRGAVRWWGEMAGWCRGT